MEIGLSTIGQIAVTDSEVDRAIAFYRDKLGMKLLFQVPNMGFFDCGGIRLMLTGAVSPGENHNSIASFARYRREPPTSRDRSFDAMPCRRRIAR